ncbi:MAG: DUF4911 domain-containing protein [Pseudomonadota bacterium]
METINHRLKVDRNEINYLRVTLESYDGMALVRTLDPHAAVIEVRISPGCEPLVLELLNDLRDREGIHIETP